MMKRAILWAVLAVGAIALLPSAFSQESSIRLGERLMIEIKGVPAEDRQEVSSIYVVNDAGRIHLPYLKNDPKAAGYTPSLLAKIIEKAYRDAQIYTSPTIVIGTQAGETTQQRVVVMGEVKSPHQVPYTAGMTLLEAIAACQGFTDFAKEKEVRIIRGNKTTTHNLTSISRNPELDVKLQPGDRVIVPQRGPFG